MSKNILDIILRVLKKLRLSVDFQDKLKAHPAYHILMDTPIRIFIFIVFFAFTLFLSGCIKQDRTNFSENRIIPNRIDHTEEDITAIPSHSNNSSTAAMENVDNLTLKPSPAVIAGDPSFSDKEIRHIVNLKGDTNPNKIGLEEFQKLSFENKKFVIGLAPRELVTIHARIWIELKKELDEKRFGHSERTWRTSPELVNLLKLHVKKGTEIASIGCAHGPHISWLADAVGKEGSVYAIDIDANAGYFINNYRRKWWKEHYGTIYPQVKVIKNNLKSICLPENSIDIAFMQQCHVFIWKYDKEGFINMTSTGKSINKALRKNGMLFIYEGIQENMVSKNEIIKRVEKCGFRFLKDAGKRRGDLSDHYLFMFKKNQI